MKLREVVDLLNAEMLTPNQNDMDKEVYSACGSDMMSDVLAFVKNQGMLITGLNNPQVVRTASMMDMVCIVFVRGKKPDDGVLELANKLDITVLATPRTMFSACGILYQNGLRGGS